MINAHFIKGQSRLFLLKKLMSFGVQGALLRTFYDSVVASAIFFGVVCWSSSIKAADRKRLNKLIKRASSVPGSSLHPAEGVGDRRMIAKLSSMLENTSHPLHGTLTSLSSTFSDRLRRPRCLTERYRRTLLPAAVRRHNQLFFLIRFYCILHYCRLYFFICTIVFALCCCNTANFPTMGLKKDYLILSYLTPSITFQIHV